MITPEHITQAQAVLTALAAPAVGLGLMDLFKRNVDAEDDEWVAAAKYLQDAASNADEDAIWDYRKDMSIQEMQEMAEEIRLRQMSNRN